MTLDPQAILDRVTSHAQASGHFERVNGHEPKSAPGNGLTAAVWVEYIGPAPRQSGLAVTAGLLRLTVRLFSNMLAEPQDGIDPALLAATSDLMGLFSGDFDLGGTVRNVDLLGQTGAPLSAQAGYIDVDKRLYRVYTITLPLVVNDVWTQAP